MNQHTDIMGIVVVTAIKRTGHDPTSQIKHMFPNDSFIGFQTTEVWERYLEKYSNEVSRIYIDLDSITIPEPREYMSNLWKKQPSLKIHFMSKSAEKLQRQGIGIEHWVILES